MSGPAPLVSTDTEDHPRELAGVSADLLDAGNDGLRLVLDVDEVTIEE